MSFDESIREGRRQMRICNACRYCEGYCAVWRAVERRREFADSDMVYFAHLCHDCRDCYFACPFTAPHEFGLDPPKLFSQLREESYEKYVWPRSLSRAFGKRKLGFWIVTILFVLLLGGLALLNHPGQDFLHRHIGTGAFYKVISESALEAVFIILSLWMVIGWMAGAMRFWTDISRNALADGVTLKDVRTAITYAFQLRYLGGEKPDDRMAGHRKWLHHLVFYGFLLDLASTTLAAVYSHILRVQAPYPIFNPVVILGVLGGVGIIIGTSGMLYVTSKTNHDASDDRGRRSGNAFSVSLLIVAVTGMLVLIFRGTPAMSVILVIHLGSVAALFVTAPYSKFRHFVYRGVALIRYAQEERVSSGR